SAAQRQGQQNPRQEDKAVNGSAGGLNQILAGAYFDRIAGVVRAKEDWLLGSQFPRVSGFVSNGQDGTVLEKQRRQESVRRVCIRPCFQDRSGGNSRDHISRFLQWTNQKEQSPLLPRGQSGGHPNVV